MTGLWPAASKRYIKRANSPAIARVRRVFAATRASISARNWGGMAAAGWLCRARDNSGRVPCPSQRRTSAGQSMRLTGGVRDTAGEEKVKFPTKHWHWPAFPRIGRNAAAAD